MSDATQTWPGKTAFLTAIEQERAALEAVLDRVSPAALLATTLAGARSIKDVLAHITAWEELMCFNVRGVGLGEAVAPPDFAEVEDCDEFNQLVYLKYRDRSASEIRAWADRSYGQVRALLAALPDAAFLIPFEAGRLWEDIASNTNEHYAGHRAQIAAALPEF